MENTQPAQGSAVSGQVLFYSNPQPLSSEKHAGLGLKQLEKPFAFLGKAHAVPLTVNEFGSASTSYPVIFVGEDRTPVGAMGIRQDENVFVSAEGDLDDEVYVPAFARRYPFVFANDDKNQRMLLCVDRDAPMVSNQPDVPFFENGQLSDFANNAMSFCQEFERQRRATVEFSRVMREMGLFTEKSASIQPRDAQGNPTGEPQKIADYWAIDEQKLNDLPSDKIEELYKSGMLGAIYAHMISLNNWPRIINRTLRAQAAERGEPQEQQNNISGESLQI